MKALKSFEFKAGRGGFGSKYDWDKLFDGGIYQLTEGEDYSAKTNHFMANIRARARKRGLAILVNKVGGKDGAPVSIVLQVTGDAVPSENGAPPKAPKAPPKPKGK